MKYSINSSGFIVAERDIYSLGGFIPKGSVGAKVANEDQISQDGECWVAGGDISGRPDVRVKDNAYIGEWVASSAAIHTDVITEFSGNTAIPGRLVVRCPITDPKNNFFVKDSFIGISLDVLCGPVATATAFPFGQGLYSVNSAAGTLFANMEATPIPANSCRGLAILRLGKETKIYVPTGLRCQVLWGYYNTAGQEAYSGRYMEYAPGLHTISDPVYGIARLHFWKSNGTAMTPTDLLATGAKILGHISGSVNVDIRPESVSGSYVMDKSLFLLNTDNFGLNTAQLRLLAGGLYNTSMYTPAGSTNYKIYGTFHNVQRLEYTMSLGDAHRTEVNRDRYISAYDCPLLRIDDTTYNDALAAKGNLVLRRCVVTKAIFTDNIHNGNTYEDIDFSYASDHLGAKAGNNYDMWSSHKQGEYAAIGADAAIAGLISRPENLAAGSVLGAGIDSIPLDGSLLELGGFTNASIGAYFETGKVPSLSRVRTGKPIKGGGTVLPEVPEGWRISSVYHLDENLNFVSSALSPTALDPAKPYFLALFGKNDGSDISVSDVAALNLAISTYALDKVPEITGSAYAGAGCTVRGDVKLIGDPYVNRIFDVNLWERGTGDSVTGETWEGLKRPESAGYPRLRTRGVFPVDTTVDNNFTCASGYNMLIYYFGEDGKCSGWSSWGTSLKVSDPAVAYISLLVSKTNGTDFIEDSDIPLANVKYVRAFKKRRYIVNELDRTSPEDILLGPDKWGQLYLGRTVGMKYSELRYASTDGMSLNTPINVPASATVNTGTGYARSGANLDALLVCLTDTLAPPENVALQGFALRKDPASAILPSDVPASRLVMGFTPSPRIVTPYGASTLSINGSKIRMYDNAVLSRNLNQRGEIVLQGDAVMGYDFNSGECLCSNGHSDAIIKLP